MNVHLLHAAATVCVALGALTGCTTDLSAARPGNPPTPGPTSTVGQWNVGLIVHGFNASGSANFTYADGMTRTMRFTGNESELKDTSMVLVGQTVSITVIVEESSGTPSQASCAITEADFDAEGSIQVVGNGGSKGERFTCTWTNDGTLETPEPEK